MKAESAPAYESGYVAEVDQDFCMGSGVCEHMASSLFQIGDDGLAEWVGGNTPRPHDELAPIAKSCPQSAITLKAVE